MLSLETEYMSCSCPVKLKFLTAVVENWKIKSYKTLPERSEKGDEPCDVDNDNGG